MIIFPISSRKNITVVFLSQLFLFTVIFASVNLVCNHTCANKSCEYEPKWTPLRNSISPANKGPIIQQPGLSLKATRWLSRLSRWKTYLYSIIHRVRYNNVPLPGHSYSAGKLKMTISTSGRAKPEAEVPIHVKHLVYKQITIVINERFPVHE